ncbi:MAG: hypothetical protein JW871_06460 [Endomicrobiales bacterium]|nr:hypothetical protein [Endomicrobiales bacterium]
MKRFVKHLLPIVCFLFFASNFLYAKLKVAPYYSIDVVLGGIIPNKGGSMFALDIVNDLGLIVQPHDKHQFIGFYELKYDGPGLKRQEGEDFSDRSIDHIIFLRHQYKFNDIYTLKTQVDHMNEYTRSGTNEVLGTGLYDFKRTGFSLIGSRKINSKLSCDATFGYHYVKYPNYSDLLAKTQGDPESSIGKQDNKAYQIGASVKYGKSKASLDYNIIAYKTQKVLVEIAQPDGSFNSSDLKKDTMLSFAVSHQRRILQMIDILPSLTIKFNNSNQNYHHYTNPTEPPVAFIKDYEDYRQTILSLPTSFLLADKWESFFNIEFDWRNYSKRPPLDNTNNFVSGKQYNHLITWSTGITLKPNAITRTTFYYSYQTQTSNVKFEKYLPYNFDVHFIGINFNYTY